MTDREWYELCERNWHKAAALVADGYTQTDQPAAIPPALFTKGDETVYLARDLASTNWYKSARFLDRMSR